MKVPLMLSVLLVGLTFLATPAAAASGDPEVRRAVARGLDWLAAEQSPRGEWTADNGRYPTAITALVGIALLCEGSTTTQGKYAENVRRAVDHLASKSRPNGLIGDPTRVLRPKALIDQTGEHHLVHRMCEQPMHLLLDTLLLPG